jgi:hypothetical protein
MVRAPPASSACQARARRGNVASHRKPDQGARNASEVGNTCLRCLLPLRFVLGLWLPNGLRLSRAAPPPCSWTFQESEVEGREYQDDSYVHRQSFPEPVLEEQDIDRDDHGCHQDYVECGGRLVSHFSPRSTVPRSSGCLTNLGFSGGRESSPGAPSGQIPGPGESQAVMSTPGGSAGQLQAFVRHHRPLVEARRCDADDAADGQPAFGRRRQLSTVWSQWACERRWIGSTHRAHVPGVR